MPSTFKNPHYPFPDTTDIVDIDWNHPDYGWIPCTISQAEYPELWAAVQEAGNIAAYTAPDPVPEPEQPPGLTRIRRPCHAGTKR